MVSNAVLRNIWLVVGILTALLCIAHAVDLILTENWDRWWICVAYAIWSFLMFRLYAVFRHAVRKGNLYGHVRLRKRR